jgi:hypothetical protein
MESAITMVSDQETHFILIILKKISFPLKPFSLDTQTKLTNNAAAAGLGNPKKYFFSSRSSLTLKRASLNAAQQQ